MKKTLFLNKSKAGLSGLLFTCLIASTQSGFGQASILWSSAGGAAWLTGSNWTGGSAPTSADIAQFGVNPTSAAGVGINLNTPTNHTLAAGAMEVTSARTAAAMLIGNSSTSASGDGTVFLTGVTVNAIPNVIIRNNSSQNLTIQNTQSSGNRTMDIMLANTTDNRIMQDAGGKIIISSRIMGSASNPLTIAGAGNSEVDITGTANTFAGQISLLASETVFSADGSFGAVPGSVNASAIVIDGGRMTAATTYTLNANRGIKVGTTAGTSISVKTGASVLTYNGVISDLTSNGSWSKQGGNMLQLGGSSIYTGATSISSGTIQLLNGNDRLPVTTVLNLGQSASTNLGVFHLNGFNQEVAGLNSVAGTNATANRNTVTSSTQATLTINNVANASFGDGSAANSGIISGAITFVKNGSGVQTLGDINTYTGATIINAGELRFSPNANESLSSSAIILNGGTLSTTGIAANKTLAFSTLYLAENSSLNLEGTNTHTLNFAASSGVTWISAKTLTITGWQGNYSSGTSGTTGKIFVGSSASDLTAAQLLQIKFFDGSQYYGAALLATGELVPASTAACTAPTATLSVNGPLCAGSTLSLTASITGTADTYMWTGPNSFTSSIQNPVIANADAMASGDYTLVVTNSCDGFTATASATVNALPVVTANSATVCAGETATLTASGADTYTWSTASNATVITVAPSTATTYTISGMSAAGCTGTNTAMVTVNAIPSLTVPAVSICSGGSATLTASGADTYSWSTGATGSTISDSPAMTTDYTVTGTSPAGCVNTSTTSIIVSSTPSITANSVTICAGQPATLTATGVNTYTWNTSESTNTIVVTPSGNTTYTVGGNASGCSVVVEATLAVTVNTVPVILVNTATVCPGITATLTASGAGTYTWNTSSNASSITAAPATTTDYTVTGTSAQGCAGSATTEITVTPTPTVSVNSATICEGSATTLTASGANTYSWSTSATDNTISVSPATTTTYSVTGYSLGCSSVVKTVTVTVNALPTVTVPVTTICSGSTGTLTASGASTYTWNDGSNGATFTDSPVSTTNYTVFGTSAPGCVNSATSSIIVSGAPGITVNSPTICAGASATLTASGVNTYTWSTSENTSSIVVNPTSTTVYTVNGNAAGCSAISNNTVLVTVNPTPTVTVNSPTICAGQTATVIASGAATYSWNTTSTSATINPAPAATTNYTVTGTTALGCAGSVTTQVVVNGLPTVTVNSPTICSGQTATVIAGGAATYSWNTTSTSATINPVPAATTSYTVYGTTALGCVASKTTQVVVNATPTVAVNSPTICAGQAATVIASGATTYSWNTTSTSATINPVPAATTNYTVYGTTAGCVGSKTTQVVVNANPTVTVNSPTICAGQTATVIAGGATTYSWNTTSTSATINPAPSATTSYTVNGTTAGCTASVIAQVVVNGIPTITVNSPTICAGQTATVIAGGAATYTWNTSSTSATINPVPSTTTSYTVNGSTALGCVASKTTQVVVNANPTLTVNSPTVCAGANASLTASGAVLYGWAGPNSYFSLSQNPVITGVTAAAAGNYTVVGAALGCSATAVATLVITNAPVITVNSATICTGSTATLTAAGVDTFTWNPSLASTSSIVVNPASTTVYTVSGEQTGCPVSAMNTATITVNPLPAVTVNSATICAGSSAVLTASGAATYTWATSNNASVSVNPSSTTAYTVTGFTAEGCASSVSTAVTVNPLPVVSLSLGVTSSTVCVNDASVTLTGSPAGGAYSGTGVTGSSFSPTLAGTYTVVYTYTNSSNCTNSDSKTLVVDACTGIKENKNTSGVSLFPNPVTDKLQIRNDAFTSSYTVELSDLSGKQLYSGLVSQSTGEIDMTSYAKGVYMLRVLNNGHSSFIKIIKD